MADPLSLLREFHVNKKPIIEKNNQIIFEEYSWSKTVKTNYLIQGTGKEGTPKDYYTLECLLFFLNTKLSHPEYVRDAATKKIPAVRRPDRKELLAYLYGDSSNSASIDKSAPIEKPTIVKQIYDERNQQEIVKKPRLDFSMADPLSSLREFHINKKPIIEKNNQIIFGEYSWPKTVKTNYPVQGSGKEGTPKDYYTLECLLFFLRTKLFHPEYVRDAAAKKIPAVRRPDRKDLLAYLYGDTNSSASIDKLAPIEKPTIVKHIYEEQNQQQVVKKPKLEENEVQKVKDGLASPKEVSQTTEHIRSLSDAMSAERIAAIKAKRSAKKRSTNY